jgi:hypothetical protein
MAHLHFRRTVYKAGSTAASSRLEYVTGRKVTEQDAASRQIRYQQEGREDLVGEGTRNLPDWAQGNPHTYFRAAEQYERQSPHDSQRRGVSFEEWKLSLPRELNRDANTALMEDLLAVIAGDTLPITYAFHAPLTLHFTSQQPHLHLLLSGRITDGVPRTPSHHFKRYNRAHPERGGARKDPALNHAHAVKAWRVTITDVINLHLERAGLDARVHPDTLAARGMDRDPEPKLLPSESRAYRERGEVSPTMQAVLDVRAQRTATARSEQADAQAYWVARKATLGLTDAIDLPTQLAVVTLARAHVRDHAPVRAGTAHAGEGEDQAQQVAHDPGDWSTVEGDLQALLRQLDTLGARQGQGEAVRVRLWEHAQGWGR